MIMLLAREARFVSQFTPATPSRRRGAPAGRRFRVPAAPCARSPARCATAAPDRRSQTGVGPEQTDDAGALVVGRLGIGRAGRVGSGSSTGRSMPRPRIGSSTAITSAASVTKVAPCLSRPLVPSARGSSGEPGTANTSRPCSPAIRAVISEPERRAASTMTTPTESPEISRLRRGKSRPRGSQPSGISEMAAPVGRICSSSGMLGRIDAIVAAGQHRDGAGRKAARCAAASMPRARPETMPKPASPRSRAIRSANFAPAAEALREPTMAISGRIEHAELAAHAEQRRRDRRSSAAAPDNPARRARSNATPRARAAFNSRSAHPHASRCAQAGAPPRRASPGSASSAARAPPQ